VVAVLVSAATVAALVWLRCWVDGLTLADPEKRATAQLDALKLAASIVVGGGGLFALYLTARRQRTQELELDARHAELAQRDRVQVHAEQVAETNRLHAEQVAADARVHAEAQRITELYTKASEQLGSEKAPVRLAGLYALERLAQDNPHQRQTVVNVLCAYLRMPYMLPGDPPAEDADEKMRDRYDERIQEREVRLTAQRVLATHLRPGDDSSRIAATFWKDTDLDLTGATLIDFDLADCKIRRARFDMASFWGNASFKKVVFEETALFDEAVFSGLTSFREATFVKIAGFADAVFSVVGFKKTRFGHVAMFGATTFKETVKFDTVRFEGDAWFREAKFLGYAKFDRVTFDRSAKFDEMTLGKGVVFDTSVVVHPVPARSSWPKNWQPSEGHGPIEGREGTWHRLVQIDTASSDQHKRPVLPDAGT
jgi:hypothetical protein